MPEDDKTHPIPDLTGYITEVKSFIARFVFTGIFRQSTFCLRLAGKDKGIGQGKTREDHSETMNQLFAAYARGKEAKELATILGEAALSIWINYIASLRTRLKKSMSRKGTIPTASIEGARYRLAPAFHSPEIRAKNQP